MVAKLKKYTCWFEGAWARVWRSQNGFLDRTVFVTKDEETLVCGACMEELGPLTDANIDHQSEYHSCSTK